MTPDGHVAAPAPPVDISNCDREPVRVPGAVQPHGALLVVDGRDLTVVTASESTADLFGLAPRELLGRDVACLALAADVEALTRALRDERVEDHNPVKVELRSGRRLNAIMHRQGERVVVEFEPDDDAPEFRSSYLLNRVYQSLTLLRAAADLGSLCARAARYVRDLTGFDRVIVYAFQPDWTGKVVAEDCADGAPRYLDLRFPASDIPGQARALYAECRLRMIPTSTYAPAPLVTLTDGPPLDLTHACLRSISPVHLEYMRNMGVTASMGISIMDGDRLWGLITCNHESGERFVPYQARAACGLLGDAVSSLVSQKEGIGMAEGRAASLDTQARLVQFIVQGGDVVHGLTAHKPSLVDVVESTGAALSHNGEVHVVGRTPPRSELEALLAWIEQQGSDTLVVESLPERYPRAHAWKDVACGIVASAVSFGDSSVVSQKTWLLWFRPEVVQTVTWGGDPRKPAAEGDDRLHPRKSFERWREDVHLKSLRFAAREIAAARSFAADLVDVVLEVEASRQIREKSRLLDAARRQIQLVLDATGAGLVSVARDGRLLEERSRAFSTWFPGATGRPRIWDVLFADDERAARDFEVSWEQLATNTLPFEVCVDQMCRRTTHDGRSFELDFKEVREGGELTSILVTLEDITALAAARRAARDAAEGQAIVAMALHDARGLGRALAELSALSRAARDDASPADAMRALHTLKGNAGVLGFLALRELCHEVEDRVTAHDDGISASADDMDAVDEEIARIIGRVHELAGGDPFGRVEVPIGVLEGAIDRLEHGGTASDALAELKLWALEPASRQLGQLAARARSQARVSHKKIEVVVVDGGVRVDAELFEPLWGALAHAVSNAVDHGIEDEALRIERGKAAAGRILLSAADGGDGWLTLEVSDDGGGVDLDAARLAAARHGLPSATRADVLEALFADRVSTRGEVTSTSGRGVGLAALRDTCVRLGGGVSIETTPGLGTKLCVRVPSMPRAAKRAS
jgi:light-regulated signal transduction histidine kinase (bacteriophytochrome)